jgi:signal transduction histidine kinase
LDYWRDLPLADVVSRAAAAPDDAVVLFLRQRLSDASRDIESIDGLSRVLAASRVPVFVINDVHLGSGAVGWIGLVVRHACPTSGSDDEVDRQRHPGERDPIGRMERVAKVDWRQLERWQIEEERLPSGSVVTFRTPSVFEQYRFAIAAARRGHRNPVRADPGLLAQRASRRRAERANADMRDELSHVTRISALGELTASLAHEVVQPLTAIMSNAQAALLMLGSTDSGEPAGRNRRRHRQRRPAGGGGARPHPGAREEGHFRADRWT